MWWGAGGKEDSHGWETLQSSGDALGPGCCSLTATGALGGGGRSSQKIEAGKEPRGQPHLGACDNHTSQSEGHKGVSQVGALSSRPPAVLPTASPSGFQGGDKRRPRLDLLSRGRQCSWSDQSLGTGPAMWLLQGHGRFHSLLHT